MTKRKISNLLKLLLFLNTFVHWTEGQCDGTGNDDWVCGYGEEAGITYTHLWVDPVEADIFAAGHTTKPQNLENTLSADVTRSAFISYHRE